MLIGEYTHTIDPKNRLSLPSKFRKEIGKSMIITLGLDGCLFIFTKGQWDKISQELSNSSMLKADSRSFNRYLLGQAVESEVDGAGRILIPDFLRKRIDGDKAVFVGVQSRVEVWGEKAWGEYKRVVEGEAHTLAERLGNLSIF